MYLWINHQKNLQWKLYGKDIVIDNDIHVNLHVTGKKEEKCWRITWDAGSHKKTESEDDRGVFRFWCKVKIPNSSCLKEMVWMIWL